MTKTIAVLYSPGPNWIRGRPLSAQPLRGHVAYLKKLHARGQLSMGGPFTDESGGLVILTVDSIDQARELIARDPAVIEGILFAEVHAWDRVV